MSGNLNRFCDRMRYWCDEGNLGYCQTHRQDIFYGGEADCSSLVVFALKEAGFDTGSASYTGNMSENLCARGWVRVANDGNPRKGDILLNDWNHVAVWLGDCLAQASSNEFWGITGGAPGDQGRPDGSGETNTRSYYNYPWDCYLRWAGESEEPDMPSTDLDVDGYWGPATTRALQEYFGTPVDGIVSDQYVVYRGKNPGLTKGWEWHVHPDDGSLLIRAMQEKLGVKVDGFIGPETIKALQKYYNCVADGELWEKSPCIKKMQAALNDGAF